MKLNNSWFFAAKEKKLDHFCLNNSVNDYLTEVVLLPKYEEEDFECYEIKNSNHSKLFVQKNTVKAIQAGKSFFYLQTEFINNHKNNILKLLGKPDSEEQNILYYKELRLTIYCLDDNSVRWATVDCW